MQDLTITLIQPNQLWEDVSGNFANYERLLASTGRTDLIVLPEMFQTSFSMNTEFAETMDGSSVQWLKNLAHTKNAAVYTSLMIQLENGFVNRGVFVHPDGNIESYDKRKLFGLGGEDLNFTAGTKEHIAEYKGWKFQLQICYDLRFPEIVRNEMTSAGDARYDAILYVANWPEKRSAHWRTLLRARAIENQSIVIAANRVGKDINEFSYLGDSVIYDGLGEEIAALPAIECVETHVINKTKLAQIREMLPFLKDR
jgi:omega-amidase